MRILPMILSLLLLGCSGSKSAPALPPMLGCPQDTLDSVLTQPTDPEPPIQSREVALDITDANRFCTDTPKAVLCSGRPGKALTFEEVVRIDAKLRADFHYASDQARWGKTDYWSNATLCGDCEDYALTLSERLADAGEGGKDLALMLWSPGGVAGHATLLVLTADSGVVEIGVNAGEEPHVYGAEPVRLGMIVMDGRFKMTLMPGVIYHKEGGLAWISLTRPPSAIVTK